MRCSLCSDQDTSLETVDAISGISFEFSTTVCFLVKYLRDLNMSWAQIQVYLYSAEDSSHRFF
jgi:hypothetical protein